MPSNVSIQDFAHKVAEMRALQRTFFRGHDPTVLEKCKKLEREVDELCRDIFDHQPKLFG